MTTPDAPYDHGTDTSEAELPQFATVMRGYDRGQVDDYVARLNDFVADAEQRAQRAERSVTDITRRNERLTEELRHAIERQDSRRTEEPYEGLGERVEHIFRLAGEEADSIRAHARAEAAEIVADAQRRRETERENAERELTAVATRRDAVVGELRRVQDVLATLGLRQAVAAEAAAEGSPTPESALDPAAGSKTADVSDPDATRVIQLPSAAARP